MAPAIFTACSIIVLLFMLGGGEVIWRFSLFSWINLTITQNAVQQSVLIFFRVFGCTDLALLYCIDYPYDRSF